MESDTFLFEPTYLNLEFFFNQVIDFFVKTEDFVAELSGGAFFVPHLKTLGSIMTILLITIVIYAFVRIFEIKKEDKKKFIFKEPEPENGGEGAERWEVVQSHLNSNTPGEWRLAIIEADSMLDDVIKKMGYEGESLGERLKAIDQSDLSSVQSAWEAHKVRNQIAHEGSGFQLDHREAKRIIGLYETVFKEFGYI